jgi:prepilin-type N-terminal cleavage/methylation domain-containing protein
MLNKVPQGGFTLVETMISMALLATAITFGMNFMGEQNKSRNIRTKQSIQRYIAIQVTQHINGNLSAYPPVAPVAASDKIVYVGCITKDGVLIANKFTFHVSSTFSDNVSTTICPLANTHFEVRFYWVNPSLDEVKINLLTLQPGTTNSLTVHNFKIFAK